MPEHSHTPFPLSSRLHAFFHAAPSGRLFTLYRGGNASDAPLVILVAPFAEEMNAARRAYSALARTLAGDGFASLMFDFHASGDSDGDFADVHWDTWQQDLQSIVQFARNELSFSHIQLLGLRSAALIIAELLQAPIANAISQLILWQPLLRGSEQIDQFLRLRVAANMMLDPHNNASAAETTQSLRQLAEREGAIDVAGYRLSQALIAALDQRHLVSLLQQAAYCPTLHWLDIGAVEQAGGARAAALQSLRDSGTTPHYHSVAGKRFWAVMEAPLPQQLIQQTVACIRGAPR